MSHPPDLGPLPEPLKPMEWQQVMWTAAQVEAERQRCYMLGVAAASQWRPIETAPMKGHEAVIVCSPIPGGGYYVEEAWYDEDLRQWWPANTNYGDAHGSAIYPTLWQPLPSAPTKEGG